MSANQFVLFVTGLIVVFGPPANISVFAALTANYPRSVQRRMALRVALSYALSLIVIAWLGERILSLLGISVPALQAAGGLLLLITGFQMISGDTSNLTAHSMRGAPGEWRALAAVPFTFPLAVGGATISLVIATATAFDRIPDMLAITAAIVGVAVFVWLTYFFAPPLSRRLGVVGIDILTRVTGIIVLALGFSLVATGLIGLLPGLG